jgi:hypothetical protein
MGFCCFKMDGSRGGRSSNVAESGFGVAVAVVCYLGGGGVGGACIGDGEVALDVAAMQVMSA